MEDEESDKAEISTEYNNETEDENFTEPFESIPEESEEEKEEKAFQNELQTILQKLKDLPSVATEMKVPMVKTIMEIYSKLCKALNVSENSMLPPCTESEIADFAFQCLGPVGIIPLAKALISCKKIKVLNLKYNKLGAGSLPAIVSLLEQNENITHLNLSTNNIGKNSAHLLSDLISRCHSVEFLDLSNNDLGDEELQEVGLALMKIDRVKELNLNTNDFSSSKAPPFGSFISKCSALQKLDISRCHIEEGAANIFGGLKISNLTILNFSKNGIPNSAMPALASGLRANKSLQELDISYNFISSKGAVALAPGLKGSSTLEILNLAHNPIQGSAATSLLSAAGGNLKLLDLSGIKVNLAFFKTLKSYAKAGRELKVLFGAEIRYDYFPRDFMAPDEDSVTKDNALVYLGTLADEKGVSLRNVLKSIHANFITEQHAALSQQSADGKVEEKRPDMSVQDLAKGLVNSPIAISKALAQEVAELLGEDGIVNMWKLITKLRWRPDDLNVKIKAPKKSPPVEKPKKKK